MGSINIGRVLLAELVAVFIIFFLVMPTTQAYAQVLNISATVPVSDLWAQAIVRNSEVFSVTQGKETAYFVILRGPNDELLDNHIVQMEIFSEDKLVETFIQKTTGFARFSFLPRKDKNYTVVFTDITWEQRIKIKQEKLVNQRRINIFKALKTYFLLSSSVAQFCHFEPFGLIRGKLESRDLSTNS